MSDKGKMAVKRRRKNSITRKTIPIHYFRYGAGMLLLIALAFFTPQLILSAQDRYQMDRIWQGARNSLDMGEIYDEYGDMRERMEAFAHRLEENYTFYVAGTEHRMDEEFFDIMDNVIRQEGYEMLLNYGMAPDMSAVASKGYMVDEWKKYVMYNDISEEESNAVILSGWYLEFTMRNDVTVKMLVDTETYDLYYLQMLDYAGMDSRTLDHPEKSQTVVTKKPEKYGITDAVNVYDMLKYNVENWYLITDWLGYWFEYYEAGENLIQTYEGYLQSLETKGAELFSYHEGINYEEYRFSMDLPYWQNVLNWEMKIGVAQDGKAPNTFSIGLRDVAERIAELQEGS